MKIQSKPNVIIDDNEYKDELEITALTNQNMLCDSDGEGLESLIFKLGKTEEEILIAILNKLSALKDQICDTAPHRHDSHLNGGKIKGKPVKKISVVRWKH